MLVAALAVSCTVDTVCHTTKKIQAGIGVDEPWDTLTVRGIGSDLLIYDHAKNVKTFYVTLRADTNITQFEIEWKHQLDTLSIRHIRDFQYVSLACGCNIYHVIDSVWSTQHFIKETIIEDSDVQETITGHEVTNIRLVVNEP